MGLSFVIIATCLIFGAVAAVASFRPNLLPELNANLRNSEPIKRFSPQNTLFIVGPSASHSACRMQRKLLKPAIPALIREDVTVMEVYGDDRPRKNGEFLDWLDPSLLRHAIDAETGFFIIFVDAAGKTRFRSEAPMITADILRFACLDIKSTDQGKSGRKSSILEKLRAA